MISATESGWAYNGPLSTYAEWHALLLGVHAGLAGEGDTVLAIAFGDRDAETKAEREVRSEPWYATAGVLLVRGYRRVS